MTAFDQKHDLMITVRAICTFGQITIVDQIVINIDDKGLNRRTLLNLQIATINS